MSIGSVILAAGQSTRMAPLNKLLLDVDGVPCVRHVARTALDAGLAPVVVVVGYQAEHVTTILDDLPVSIRHNPDYTRGMGSSIGAGIAALPDDLAGAGILLGDMPLVTGHDLRRLAAGLADGAAACVPVVGDRRGNPVFWSGAWLPELRTLPGDRGARDLLRRLGNEVREIPVDGEGVLMDVDTADAAADLRTRLARAAPPMADSLERLAASTPRRPPESAGDELKEMTLDGRFCPDRAEIRLILSGTVITGCSCRVSGCLLCRAAAGVLNEHLAGQDSAAIVTAARHVRALAMGKAGPTPADWRSLAAFDRLSEFPARINCVLLPFEVASRAADSVETVR